MIWAVNSGQDDKSEEWLTKDLAFIKKMMEKIPGLPDVMSDPNGSIYLTEGMCDIAMPALAVAMFNTKQTIKGLVRVPIEYIENAIKWLKENWQKRYYRG